MQARFTGDPRNAGDDPPAVTLGGQSFPKGEWVAVESHGLFARLCRNSHFETRTAINDPVQQAPAPEAEKPVKPQKAPYVFDGTIPADWRTMHWRHRVTIAKALDPDMAAAINSGEEADLIIEAHEVRDEQKPE